MIIRDLKAKLKEVLAERGDSEPKQNEEELKRKEVVSAYKKQLKALSEKVEIQPKAEGAESGQYARKVRLLEN